MYHVMPARDKGALLLLLLASASQASQTTRAAIKPPTLIHSHLWITRRFFSAAPRLQLHQAISTSSSPPPPQLVLSLLASTKPAQVITTNSSRHPYTTVATMSSKLIPTDPEQVMAIRQITPNVVTCSVPFSRFGVVRVGGRGTIVRMTTGGLAVFSPVALTPTVKSKIAELVAPGTGKSVDYIIAGDIEHHIFLSEWKKEFPAAKVLGPEGLPEKRAKVTNDDKVTQIDFHHVFNDENHDGRGLEQEFLADFDVEYVSAHANKEVVLCYKPDKVLIQADLFFNLPAREQYSRVPADQHGGGVLHGLMNKFFQSFQNTEGEAKGNKRFQWYVLSAGNRDKYNESIRRIMKWDFDAVIPCHGETIEKGGKDVFSKVFQWHLQGSK